VEFKRRRRRRSARRTPWHHEEAQALALELTWGVGADQAIVTMAW